VKARIVSEDPRELGRRALLNLGHTIGHALESVGGYSRLTHGEAISLGLVAALEVGRRLGHTPDDLCVRVRELLARFDLPTALRDEPLEAASSLIGHDKKRAGAKIRFVFAHAPGDVRTHDLELDEVQRQARALASAAA
jgi:3-dehydroquinate synthetase